MIMLLRISLLLLFFSAVILPTQALAVVNVSPLIIDRDIEPRDIVNETVTLTNTTSNPMRLFATVNEITLGENGAIKTFVTPSMADQTTTVTSWIEVKRGRIELPPGESVTIPVTFRINPGAVAGDYHAFIGFAHGSNRDEAEAKVFVGEVDGVIVRLSLAKKTNQLLRLTRFSTDRFMTTLREHAVSYTLENPGDVPLIPQGEVIFYNSRGEEVSSVIMNSEGKVLAPGEKADYVASVSAKGLFGKYKAFLNVEYGSANRAAVYDTAFFYALPVPLLVGIFAALFFLILMFFFLLRHRLAPGDHPGDDDGYVVMKVRTGGERNSADHDIDLKKTTS